MKIILETRCGCIREEEGFYPAQPYILIPLRPDVCLSSDADVPPSAVVHVRRFDLYRIVKPGPEGIYYYYERLKNDRSAL